MYHPLAPCREARGRVADRFTPVKFRRRRDVEFGGPLGEFLLGHWPGRAWSSSQALVESLPLLGRREFEVADHDGRTDVCCCLSQSGPLVSTPKTVIDKGLVECECGWIGPEVPPRDLNPSSPPLMHPRPRQH